MNEIETNQDGINTVNARDLHRSLGSRRDFSNWIKAKVVGNPFFMENQDYILLNNSGEQTFLCSNDVDKNGQKIIRHCGGWQERGAGHGA